MEFLQDIKTAVAVFGEVRKIRKAGASALLVKPVYTVPAVHFGYWGFTPEGCLFCGEKWQPLRDVFDNFPEETQHALCFVPKDGEWGGRVRFWQRRLRPALEPELYHEAILTLVQWGIRCRCRRRSREAESATRPRF